MKSTYLEESNYLNSMRAAYLEAAWWADAPEENMGDYMDAGRDTRNKAMDDCKEFYKKALEAGCNLNQVDQPNFLNPLEAGHNLWLSRCGHGTGFWDNNPNGTASSDGGVYRHWDDETAEKLHEIAQAMGCRYVYVVAEQYFNIE